jgi:hypothetical protein
MTTPLVLRVSVSAVLVSLGVVASGCGSSGHKTAATTTATTNTNASNTQATLIAAVRAAVSEDHRMSVRVLWTNAVPAHPRATAGPALAVLRRSVAGRARRGIRVRLVSERFRVISIRLDPSYARATAVVYDPQRVRPYGRDGRPLGRAVTLNERARLELRRLGSSTRFVVWKVTAIK